jgi:hypothetical protein
MIDGVACSLVAIERLKDLECRLAYTNCKMLFWVMRVQVRTSKHLKLSNVTGSIASSSFSADRVGR